jgi:hypothetical protein
MEKASLKDWNKAYWTVRAFFAPGSPAADQIKVYDDTADLPELWRTFNVNYVAAANFSGLFSLYEQLHGPAYIQKNPLAEFIRQNDLQMRIIRLKDQPHVNFMQTPQKAFFQSPLTRRVINLETTTQKEKDSSSSDSEDGGATKDQSKTTSETDRVSVLEGNDEWRRVMSTLFTMKNQTEHGQIILKFIEDVLLREESKKSVFSLTEQKVYASLKTFLEFRQLPTTNFKTLSTSVITTDSSTSCGQPQCKKTQEQTPRRQVLDSTSGA